MCLARLQRSMVVRIESRLGFKVEEGGWLSMCTPVPPRLTMAGNGQHVGEGSWHQHQLQKYTVKSLQFMLTLEPENEKMKQKLEWAKKQREANQPTVPSTIGDEFEINTFMRVDQPEIQAKFGAKSPVEALREVRKIKDNWKG